MTPVDGCQQSAVSGQLKRWVSLCLWNVQVSKKYEVPRVKYASFHVSFNPSYDFIFFLNLLFVKDPYAPNGRQ